MESTNEHTCLFHLREHPPYLSTVSVPGAPARVPHAAPSIFHYLLRFASLPGVVFSYSSRFLQHLCPLFMLGRACIPCFTGKTTRFRSRGTVTYVTYEVDFMIHRRSWILRTSRSCEKHITRLVCVCLRKTFQENWSHYSRQRVLKNCIVPFSKSDAIFILAGISCEDEPVVIKEYLLNMTERKWKVRILALATL